MIRVERTAAAALTGAKWTGTSVGFGRELRDERERLGVPLEALAEATKVPVRNLRALESDHWTELPGGVFTKGIVRGYCKFLGLPEHPWMERLETSSDRAAAEPDWVEFAQAVKRSRVRTSPMVRRRWWGVAGMLLALVALAWTAWHYVLHERLPQPLRWPAKGGNSQLTKPFRGRAGVQLAGEQTPTSPRTDASTPCG